jgi:hypothetical protein
MTALLNPAELNHNQATANLFIEGLSVTHFKKPQKTWEINFLRNAQHKLRLDVTGKDPIYIEPGVPITISTVRGIVPDFEQFPNGYWFSNQQFNRITDQGHDEDFRWVPDLANRFEFTLHALVRNRETFGQGVDSINKLSVPNVVFFTREKTWYSLTQAVFNIPDILPYGRTNTTIGADIFCEEGGEVVIEIDGREYARLRHVAGSPHQIEFENSDSAHRPGEIIDIFGRKFIKGDFALNYGFLNVIGIHYEMLCPSNVFHSDDCDCNPSFVSSFD